MNRATRVVIATEHLATRAGISQALTGSSLEVCAQAATASSAVEATGETSADACLLDVNLPGGGVAAAAEIKARRPATTVVMLAEAPSAADLLQYVQAGASGYLPAAMDPERLSAALADACAGAAAIPRRMVSGLIEALRTQSEFSRLGLPAELEQRLSRREVEVLSLLESGLSTSAVAAQLGISPVTVRRHISSLLEKLGVPDRESVGRLLASHRNHPRATVRDSA